MRWTCSPELRHGGFAKLLADFAVQDTSGVRVCQGKITLQFIRKRVEKSFSNGVVSRQLQFSVSTANGSRTQEDTRSVTA